MSFIKILILLILIFTVNCSGNKVSNYHGAKYLEDKYNEIILDKTNKNDLINLIGPPSTISDFDKNKWFYFERLKANQSLIKLGSQKIKKNNVLIVELKKNSKTIIYYIMYLLHFAKKLMHLLKEEVNKLSRYYS